MDGGVIPIATGPATPSGSFKLTVGSTTTGAIDYDGSDLTTTASNMQSALVTAGFTGATVSVVSTTEPSYFNVFKVTFTSSESPITYVASPNSPLPVTFTNSVSASATVQQLTFEAGLTTDGTTKIPDGSHQFTVEQATPEATLYANWAVSSTQSGQSEFGPGSEYSVPTSAINSAASAATTLSIGFEALSQPLASAQPGVLYSYTVTTNAPSSDTVTVTPGTLAAGTLPPGMQFDAKTDTFTWTPTSAQVSSTPYQFQATVTDSLGNSVTISQGVVVSQGVVIPVDSTTGNVSVSFSGSQVLISDNSGSSAQQATTSAVTISCSGGQALSITLPSSTSGLTTKQVLIQGATGNQVTVVGSGGANNTFTLTAGSGSDDVLMGNGLELMLDPVQNLTLQGGAGKNDFNDFELYGSSNAMAISVDPVGSDNTLDFNQLTDSTQTGVTVNLGLNKGTQQTIAPLDNSTLSINGAINTLIGTPYADTLTGGSGENVIIGGGGGDTIYGGTGKNLIIAGSGNCSITTNGSENMIFCGTTNWDSNANDQALLNLLNEGPMFMYSYSYRQALANAARHPGNAALQSDVVKLTTYTGARDAIFGSLKNSVVLR